MASLVASPGFPRMAKASEEMQSYKLARGMPGLRPIWRNRTKIDLGEIRSVAYRSTVWQIGRLECRKNFPSALRAASCTIVTSPLRYFAGLHYVAPAPSRLKIFLNRAI